MISDDERHVFPNLAWGRLPSGPMLLFALLSAIGISEARSSHLLQPVDPERFVRRSCGR